MRKSETTVVLVMEEKIAREKVKEWYKKKKNLSIGSCIPTQRGDKGFEITFSYDEPEESTHVHDNYVCSFCGKKGVKLWRPYYESAPLICATCAEERQSPKEYYEVIWEKKPGGHYTTSKPTDRKLLSPKWQVDEKGKIPFYDCNEPDGLPHQTTDQLIINRSDIFKGYSSTTINMVPAIPNHDGHFWSYLFVPEDGCEWWDKLPTR